MAAKRVASDGVEFTDDGHIKVVVDGVTRLLRRPKIGELRSFMEGLGAITAAEKESGPVSGLGESAEALVGWWSDVIDTLCSDDLPLSTDVDDLPVWLLNAELVNRATSHWREVPYLSGG